MDKVNYYFKERDIYDILEKYIIDSFNQENDYE